MAYSIHLRVDANLLGVARILRLLRRFAVNAGDVGIEHFLGREVTSMRGTLAFGRSAEGLAAALVSAPDVLHAVIFNESRVVVEFSRRKP